MITRGNLYNAIPDLIQSKKPFAIATVTETSRSTPQKPGSSALFGENGLLDGTVGGGRVEYDIQKKAAGALHSGESGYFGFDLDEDLEQDDSVICGGGMHILLDVEPQKHLSVFKVLRDAYVNRIPGVLATVATRPEQSGGFVIDRFWLTAQDPEKYDEQLGPEGAIEVKKMFDKPVPGGFRSLTGQFTRESPGVYVFLESIVPLPELWIAGAGHVGKALAHMGKLLDFEVTVWDDRKEFANKKNLPDADYVISGNLKTTFGTMEPGKETFIVIVTRGHHQDSDVLKAFIGSGAGYIGMIGSRKKLVRVREQFIEQGWATPEQWDQIHAPIGLKIHSKTVQEIAVSIAAQLVEVRYRLYHADE